MIGKQLNSNSTNGKYHWKTKGFKAEAEATLEMTADRVSDLDQVVHLKDLLEFPLPSNMWKSAKDSTLG